MMDSIKRYEPIVGQTPEDLSKKIGVQISELNEIQNLLDFQRRKFQLIEEIKNSDSDTVSTNDQERQLIIRVNQETSEHSKELADKYDEVVIAAILQEGITDLAGFQQSEVYKAIPFSNAISPTGRLDSDYLNIAAQRQAQSKTTS